MITTLPGLYVVTVGIFKPLILLLGVHSVCSVTGLRFINILFQAGTFYVLREIYKTLHPPSTGQKVPVYYIHVVGLEFSITLSAKVDWVRVSSYLSQRWDL